MVFIGIFILFVLDPYMEASFVIILIINIAVFIVNIYIEAASFLGQALYIMI